MYTITMWFYCVDHLNIKHETIRAFKGEDKEEVTGRIENFRRQLDDAGWTVVQSAENVNVAHLQK